MPMVVFLVAMITSQQPSSAALPAKQRPATMPTSGTRPERRANCPKVGTSRPVMPSRRCRQAGPPPPSANITSGSRPSLGQLEHAVLLLVVALSLRAGQHRVVVGHHHAARPLVAEQLAVDRADAGDDTVGRRVARSGRRASGARRCAASTSAPYSMKLPGSTEVVDVLARRALAELAPLGHRLRPVLVEREAWRARTSARSGRIGSRSTLLLRVDRRRARRSRLDEHEGLASTSACRPCRRRCARTMPPVSATTRCCIFIASSTAICWPARTGSPSFTSMLTTVPCSGALTEHRARPAPPVAPRCAPGSCSRCGRSLAKIELPVARASAGAKQLADVLLDETRVVTRFSAKAGCVSSACRNGMLVATPSMRNSPSAR